MPLGAPAFDVQDALREMALYQMFLGIAGVGAPPPGVPALPRELQRITCEQLMDAAAEALCFGVLDWTGCIWEQRAKARRAAVRAPVTAAPAAVEHAFRQFACPSKQTLDYQGFKGALQVLAKSRPHRALDSDNSTRRWRNPGASRPQLPHSVVCQPPLHDATAQDLISSLFQSDGADRTTGRQPSMTARCLLRTPRHFDARLCQNPCAEFAEQFGVVPQPPRRVRPASARPSRNARSESVHLRQEVCRSSRGEPSRTLWVCPTTSQRG